MAGHIQRFPINVTQSYALCNIEYTNKNWQYNKCMQSSHLEYEIELFFLLFQV
jgi:hypothetical protein